MFHVASTLVALSIITPTFSTPIPASMSASRRSLKPEWEDGIETAGKVLGTVEKFLNVGSAAEGLIMPLVQKGQNGSSNSSKRSVEELNDREETRAVYQARESQDIEFMEARSGNISFKNILNEAGQAATVGQSVIKGIHKVGGFIKKHPAIADGLLDAGEAVAALLRRDYEVEIDDLD